jgi:hypothetical protein
MGRTVNGATKFQICDGGDFVGFRICINVEWTRRIGLGVQVAKETMCGYDAVTNVGGMKVVDHQRPFVISRRGARKPDANARAPDAQTPTGVYKFPMQGCLSIVAINELHWCKSGARICSPCTARRNSVVQQ